MVANDLVKEYFKQKKILQMNIKLINLICRLELY